MTIAQWAGAALILLSVLGTGGFYGVRALVNRSRSTPDTETTEGDREAACLSEMTKPVIALANHFRQCDDETIREEGLEVCRRAFTLLLGKTDEVDLTPSDDTETLRQMLANMPVSGDDQAGKRGTMPSK